MPWSNNESKGIMGLLVHSFFAWRIRLLSGSRLWPLTVLVFALPAFGMLIWLHTHVFADLIKRVPSGHAPGQVT
jgi:hypothetical protein